MKTLPLLELLVRRYPDIPRDSLYRNILCREVVVDGGRITNPRESVRDNTFVEIVQEPYVSRGGVKLEYALDSWGITAEGKVFLDAGASSGGFTDCLLSNGALKVFAVDVGYNQLDYRLRTDPRVAVMEKTNIMQVQALDPIPDAAAADLSFRSISGAARKILSLTREKWLIALIKPQFELEYPPADFTGVITDEHLLRNVLQRTVIKLQQEHAGVVKLLQSPIPGRKGNREFLALIEDIHVFHRKILTVNEIDQLVDNAVVTGRENPGSW